MEFINRTINAYSDFKVRVFIWAKNKFVLPLYAIAKFIPKGTVCELGSGLGMVSIYLALSCKQRTVVGYELSEERVNLSVDAAKNIPNVKFFKKVISKTFNFRRFDTYLMVDFLHHVPFDVQSDIFAKISKVQKKGDHIIIKEIEKKPGIRYLLNLFCDKLMTNFDKLYFRKSNEWKILLIKHGYAVRIYSLKGPFDHFIVLSKKMK